MALKISTSFALVLILFLAIGFSESRALPVRKVGLIDLGDPADYISSLSIPPGSG